MGTLRDQSDKTMSYNDDKMNEFIFSALGYNENPPCIDPLFTFRLTQEQLPEPVAASTPSAHPQIKPTPINYRGNLEAVISVNSLPTKMKQYCKECIAALFHLFADGTDDEPNSNDLAWLPQSDELPVSAPSMALVKWTNPRNGALPPGLLVSDSSCEESSVAPDTNKNAARVHPYQQEQWMERYQDLLAFCQWYGHCNVPYVFKESPCLGQWVKRQRHQYKLHKHGQHSNLDPSRIRALSMLGFIWDSHGAAWEEKFQELKDFKQIHGHAHVPCTYQGNSKLSAWIKRQRRKYRLFLSNKRSTMDRERIRKLESLGFVWDYYGDGNEASDPLL